VNIHSKAELPPFRPIPMRPPAVDVRRVAGGVVYLRSKYRLGEMHKSIAHLLEARASQHRNRNFIAERITDKGYVNQRATLERRRLLVDALYADPPAPGVVEIP